MRLLRRLEDLVVRAERRALVFVLALILVLAFGQVVLRLFSFGFVWAEILLRHLVLVAGFLGAALAARDEHHFAVDALARMTPRAVQRVLLVLGRLLAAAVALALAKAGWTFTADEWASGGVLFYLGRLPVRAAVFQAAIPAGFGLVALHFLMRLPEPPKPPSDEARAAPAP